MHSTETHGRQAAHIARKRAALIESAQEVLASIGPAATIEQLADHAHVSPTTIYNHFANKESLLTEALEQLWVEWVVWAHGGRLEGESFETTIDVCRRLLRVSPDQTIFGKVLGKTLQDPSYVIGAIRPSAAQPFKEALVKSGLARIDFETRIDVWSFSVAGIFHGVFVTKKLSPEQADNALRISLSIWNVDPNQAAEITSQPVIL